MGAGLGENKNGQTDSTIDLSIFVTRPKTKQGKYSI